MRKRDIVDQKFRFLKRNCFYALRLPGQEGTFIINSVRMWMYVRIPVVGCNEEPHEIHHLPCDPWHGHCAGCVFPHGHASTGCISPATDEWMRRDILSRPIVHGKTSYNRAAGI